MDRRLTWRHTAVLTTALALVALWGCESATAPEPSFAEQSRIVPLPRDGGGTGGGGDEDEPVSVQPKGKERAE